MISSVYDFFMTFTSVPDPYVLGLPDSLDRGTDPRIRIRANMSRIHNTDVYTEGIGYYFPNVLYWLQSKKLIMHKFLVKCIFHFEFKTCLFVGKHDSVAAYVHLKLGQ